MFKALEIRGFKASHSQECVHVWLCISVVSLCTSGQCIQHPCNCTPLFMSMRIIHQTLRKGLHVGTYICLLKQPQLLGF